MGTSMTCSQKQKLRKHVIHTGLKHKKKNNRNKQIEINNLKTKQKYPYKKTSFQNKDRVNQEYRVFGDEFIELPNDIPSIQLHSEILNPPKIPQQDQESSSQVSQYKILKNNQSIQKCQQLENGVEDIKQLKTAMSQFYHHSSSNQKKLDSFCINQHENKIEQKLRSQSSSDRFNIQGEKSINKKSQNGQVIIIKKQEINKSQKQRSQSNHILSEIIQQREIKYNTISYDQVGSNQQGISVNSGLQFHSKNNNMSNQPRRLSDNTYNYQNYAVKGQKKSIKMKSSNGNPNPNPGTQYGFQYPLVQNKETQNSKVLQNKINELRKSRQIRTLTSKLKDKDIIKQMTESITYKIKQQHKKQRCKSTKYPYPKIYHPKLIKNSITKHSYDVDEYQLHGYHNINAHYPNTQQDLKIKRSMSTNDSIDREMYRPRKLLFF